MGSTQALGGSMRLEKIKNGVVVLLDNNTRYRPADKEPFMNERQQEYFRNKLLIWKNEIIEEAKETLQHLQDENHNHPDFTDRASSETNRAIELRARDRQRKLITKIDAALARLDHGTYGCCEATGEPISLRSRARSSFNQRRNIKGLCRTSRAKKRDVCDEVFEGSPGEASRSKLQERGACTRRGEGTAGLSGRGSIRSRKNCTVKSASIGQGSGGECVTMPTSWRHDALWGAGLGLLIFVGLTALLVGGGAALIHWL
jgi:DnaK suppressor protein